MADLVLGLRSKRELCLLKWALLSALCQPTGTTAERDAARHTKHGATGGSRREQGHGSTAAKHLTKGALQDQFHPKLLRGLGASQSNSKEGSMKAFVGTTWKGRKIRNKQTGKVRGKPPNNCVCLPALGGDFHQTAEPPPLSLLLKAFAAGTSLDHIAPCNSTRTSPEMTTEACCGSFQAIHGLRAKH